VLDLCSIYGNIYDLSGNPIKSAIVRAGCYDQPNLQTDINAGYKTDLVETVTTSTGYFSISLPKGATAWLSIPAIGYRYDVTVPSDVSTVAFTTITPAPGTY